MKRAIGFDRTRLAISGAAPAAPELLEFFTGLDLPVIEEYGQSENTGICTINVEGATKVGTTGRLLPGVDMALAEDGEILVRGRNVFLGYFDDDESTKTDLRDGWLHTGDLGELDDEGFLKITGRKKDIIITAAGKNVTPALIEGKLTSLPLVSGAVVIGDRQRYLTALLTVDPDAASRHGDGDGIARQVDEHVAEVNSTLARVERIKRYTILPGPFRIEAGELTPTLKIRRRVIMENYAAEIAAMYAD
jgi:long-chain acyl-CoA synthetase